jgi:hypothetical protein
MFGIVIARYAHLLMILKSAKKIRTTAVVMEQSQTTADLGQRADKFLLLRAASKR